MRSIKIPASAPLKSFELVRRDDPLPEQIVPPVADDLPYFQVPGVKDEDVAKVLAALVERRFVERARKMSRDGDSIGPPTFGPVILTVIGMVIVGALSGLSASLAFHMPLTSSLTGAEAGAAVGLLFGLWQRAKAATAFDGLKLLYGYPGRADERLHPNYWLPHAVRRLCSPKPSVLLDA